MSSHRPGRPEPMENNVVTSIAVTRITSRLHLSIAREQCDQVAALLEAEDIDLSRIDICYAPAKAHHIDLTVTLAETELDIAERLLGDHFGAAQPMAISSDRGFASISLTGYDIGSNLRVLATLTDVLGHAGIPIQELTTSAGQVMCLVTADAAEQAVCSLQQAFYRHAHAA